jgi:hypothetical protein
MFVAVITPIVYGICSIFTKPNVSYENIDENIEITQISTPKYTISTKVPDICPYCNAPNVDRLLCERCGNKLY